MLPQTAAYVILTCMGLVAAFILARLVWEKIKGLKLTK